MRCPGQQVNLGRAVLQGLGRVVEGRGGKPDHRDPVPGERGEINGIRGMPPTVARQPGDGHRDARHGKLVAAGCQYDPPRAHLVHSGRAGDREPKRIL